MPHFEHKEKEFIEACSQLQTSIALKFKEEIRTQPVLGADFVFSVSKIWEAVVGNKDLSLPAHKIMVATVRCSEISRECLTILVESENSSMAHKYASDTAATEFKSVALTLDTID